MSARHDDFRDDWRASKPAHKTPARRLPAHVRKALRDYRRKAIPMADEPRGCDDLTTALLCFIAFAVAFVVVLAIAGALP